LARKLDSSDFHDSGWAMGGHSSNLSRPTIVFAWYLFEKASWRWV
jgi:hypothetical protein